MNELKDELKLERNFKKKKNTLKCCLQNFTSSPFFQRLKPSVF